jgi:polyphenol oxidase
MNHPAAMTFPALMALKGFGHLFTLRHPELNVAVDRSEALQRLARWHDETLRREFSLDPSQVALAEQVHGNRVAVIEGFSPKPVPATDGMVCGKAGMALGVYVADCCAVYLVDPVKGAFGLLHSGRKGTEQNITGAAIESMQANFGTSPWDIVVQLSPCIRPPQFEVDFAAEIRRQAHAAGVLEKNIHDERLNTAADLERFYSYRMEKGKTGRMLAVLARR